MYKRNDACLYKRGVHEKDKVMFIGEREMSGKGCVGTCFSSSKGRKN